MSFADLDKFNLVKIRTGGLILGSSQFFDTAQAAPKMKLATRRVKNNHALLNLIFDTQKSNKKYISPSIAATLSIVFCIVKS